MRLEVTRRADLAVQALVLLGRSRARRKAGELAEALDTTSGFVPQVLAPLVERGWVRSEPGPRGGYISTVALGSVTVLDVVEAVDGPTDVGRCVVEGRPCAATSPCALHDAWSRARAALLDELAATSLDRVPVREPVP
ncbi:MAG: Rrf2 family transcriptional regulator [Acidimicrobiales bacterium]